MGAGSSFASFQEEASSGRRLDTDLLSSLLSPLPLIDCFRFETLSRSFRLSLFRRRSFVWNGKHEEFIKAVYGLPADSDAFEGALIDAVSREMGPHCTVLRLKLKQMPLNAGQIFERFPRLQQLWLLFRFDEQHLQPFFASPGILPCDSMRELRVMLLREDGQPADEAVPNWLPAIFTYWIENLPRLTSLAAWRSEARFEKSIFALSRLQAFTMFCDDGSLRFFEHFARKYGTGSGGSGGAAGGGRLRQLTIKWVVEELDGQGNFTTFLSALGKLRVETLHLEVHWRCIKERDRTEEQALLNRWMSYMATRLATTLRRLSLSCMVVRPGTLIDSAHLLHALTFGMVHLHLLRITLLHPTLPIQIAALRVDALEVAFRYLKKNQSETKLEETISSSPVPFIPHYKNRDYYVFRKIRNERAIKSLRLAYCPLPLDGALVKHLVRWFPHLEQFHFGSLNENLYSSLDTKIDFHLEEHLIACQPDLRVIVFTDAFAKPTMRETVKSLYNRAKWYPEKVYRFDYGTSTVRTLEDYRETFGEMKELPNFRVH